MAVGAVTTPRTPTWTPGPRAATGPSEFPLDTYQPSHTAAPGGNSGYRSRLALGPLQLYTRLDEQGRVVWADSGQPVTAGEYPALPEADRFLVGEHLLQLEDQLGETVMTAGLEHDLESQLYGDFRANVYPYMEPGLAAQVDATGSGRLDRRSQELEAAG
ncbi:MAG: hypothetical protein AB1758_14760, partial [Candidatus Eremiobacterota bacterium]